MFTYQMGSLPRPKIHARLAEIHRQELRMDVGDMQERDVAEGRCFVEPLGRLGVARGRPECGARRGGEGEQLDEFAPAQPGYWLTGEAGSSSRPTRSLICSLVSVPECPSRGICEQAL